MYGKAWAKKMGEWVISQQEKMRRWKNKDKWENSAGAWRKSFQSQGHDLMTLTLGIWSRKITTWTTEQSLSQNHKIKKLVYNKTQMERRKICKRESGWKDGSYFLFPSGFSGLKFSLSRILEVDIIFNSERVTVSIKDQAIEHPTC